MVAARVTTGREEAVAVCCAVLLVVSESATGPVTLAEFTNAPAALALATTW